MTFSEAAAIFDGPPAITFDNPDRLPPSTQGFGTPAAKWYSGRR